MIGGASVLALITARGGSKRVPGKNTVLIGGRPLIRWTIDAARASCYIDRLVLSSDDPVIMDVAVAAGCEAPFRRDAALSGDEVSSIDVVVDAVRRISGHDIVVLLQPTSPLRSAEDIDGTLELLVSTGAPACVSVRRAEEHPYWTFGIGVGSRLSPFASPPGGMPLRRQDLPDAWCLNGAVYAAQVDWLLRERTFLSSRTVGFTMPTKRSLDIDTQADVERLRVAVGDLQRGAADRPNTKVVK